MITGDGKLKPRAGTGNFHNLTINASGNTIDQSIALTCEGNLTITAGTLDTDSSNNYALTVTGDASVTGTLTGNASAISLGSLTINSGGTYSATSGTTTITSETSGGYAIDHDGTFTHNNGTVLITTPATTLLDLLATGNLYNLTINHASCVARIVSHSTIDNDVTVTAGTLDTAYDVNVTVTGDVSVSGTFGHADESGAHSFGTLKVESGGTHIATSGTTSLNAAGQGHSGNPSAMEIVSGGTFVHNNGTIKLNGITDQDIEMDGTGNFYNLTIDKTNNDVIMHPNVSIENNLDITLASDHTLRPASTSNTVTVLNQTILRAGLIGATTAYDANHNWGTLTILSGTFNVGSGTNEVTAIRNVGGTIS